METLSGVLQTSGTDLAKQLQEGRAIFSTNFGQYPRREAKPRQVPIIMRSDPLADVDSMVSKLQRDYPTACRAITAPISNIYEYFDHHDVQLHGTSIISTVLNNIALQNSLRAKSVQAFADDWKKSHSDLFHGITGDTKELFTMEDEEAHDEEFLKDALNYLKQLKLLVTPVQTNALPGMPISYIHSFSCPTLTYLEINWRLWHTHQAPPRPQDLRLQDLNHQIISQWCQYSESHLCHYPLDRSTQLKRSVP